MTNLAALAAGSLISAVWQSLLLVLLLAGVFRLLPGISAAVRSVLWSVVFVLGIAFHFTSPHAAPAAHHASPVWALAITSVWVVLSLLRAGQLIVGAVGLRSLRRRATPVRAGLSIGRQRRPALLCTSTEVDRPSVIGFFRPRVVLPPELYASLQPAELEQVLLHETGHLRRADDWTNLLQKLALVLFPLNPVLLWVERRLCRERELACDDSVLAVTEAPKAYARCLLSLAEQVQSKRGFLLALGAWQRRSELAIRIQRMLSRPATKLTRPQAAGLTATAVLAMAGAIHTLSTAPQLLSFMPMVTSFSTATSAMAAPGDAPAASRTKIATQVVGENAPAWQAVGRVVSNQPSGARFLRTAERSSARMPSRAISVTYRPVSAVSRRVSRQQRRSRDNRPALTSPRRFAAPTSQPPAPVFLSAAFYAVRVEDGWLLIQL